MSSEFSASEDEAERLREAIDTNFLNENLFKSDISKYNLQEKDKLPSLRKNHKETKLNNPFSIKVSSEYQNYVSRHLAKMLDESVDDSKTFLKNQKYKRKSINRIKLLSNSKKYVSLKNNNADVKPKYLKKIESKNINYEKRAREVAVSGEWVLSQEETKYWAINTKGEFEIVKINFPQEKGTSIA